MFFFPSYVAGKKKKQLSALQRLYSVADVVLLVDWFLFRFGFS